MPEIAWAARLGIAFAVEGDGSSALLAYLGGMMLKVLENVMPRLTCPPGTCPPLRSVRPSLLDLRFTGDPWVVDHQDGTASVRLDNYRLARIQTSPFDVPSLSQIFLQLRQWQIRRHLLARRLRARAGQSISC